MTNSDRRRRIFELAVAATARDAAERAAFLNDACGDDAALRHEVEALLARESEAEGFLATPRWRWATLAPGTRLGPYEVESLLGAGGMGVVYKARDRRLDRDVAVKVLPDLFAGDPERLARFEREAKVLASLNHSNIAQVYGLEEADPAAGSGQSGVRAIVMELVEGPTLADRLARGPIPLDEALPLATQITQALEAAHEHGIIHRDLKPANIILKGAWGPTPTRLSDGSRSPTLAAADVAGCTVKVLDFGLSKLTSGYGLQAADRHATTESLTAEGKVLGTAAYMAPEQAKGRSLDRRADLWAFGCVLYEMLTGKRAFPGEGVSDTLAAVLRADPDWAALPSTTPAPIRRLLRRCLAKDPRQRLHDIADARIEIEGALAEPWAEPAGVETVPFWRRAWPVAVTATAGVLAGAGLVWQFQRLGPSASPSPWSFVLALEPGQELASTPSPAIAISPDGTLVAYAAGSGATTALYLYAQDAFDARLVPGTEGAQGPFFSADGRWVGFYAKSTLFKVPVSGGKPERICDASWAFPGASWGADDTIVFGTAEGGLRRCAARGGGTETLTTPDVSLDELNHGLPQILPDGDHVLFTAATKQGRRLAVLSLESGEWQHLDALGEASNARYLGTGHLVYGRGGSLLAVPFDVRRPVPEREPMEVRNAVFNDTVNGFPVHQFALSENGTLVYVPGGTDSNELVWVDRRGNVVETLAVERGNFGPMRLSPDNRRLAVTKGSADGTYIWVYDLERGSSSKLTTRDNRNVTPVWTPDGQRVAFTSFGGSLGSYWQSADGIGEPELLAGPEAGFVYAPRDFSPDGTILLIEQADPGYRGGSNIWKLLMEGAREPEPYIATEFDERTPRFSPDGRWVAYISDRNGNDRFEVYVQSYAGPTQFQQVSTDGGTEPVWSSDGRELFYRLNNQMMVVGISTEPILVPGKPEVLFEERFEKAALHIPLYDVARDGQRFVMVRRSKDAAPTQINVVLNWFDELSAKVPAGR